MSFLEMIGVASIMPFLAMPLIDYVPKKGKPLLIYTGMASEKEIEEAVNTTRGGGCKYLVLLHCVSCYPKPNEEETFEKFLSSIPSSMC